jgi:hypothetical protein
MTLTKNQPAAPPQGPKDDCKKDGARWEYEVQLLDRNGAVKSQVDPLVVMNWSP